MRDSLPGGTVRLSDFDFELPEELIAQAPLADRSASRLLDCSTGLFADRSVRDLPGLLEAGDLVVVNDTRVMKARLTGVRETGGRIEVLIERILDERTVLALVRASHAPPPGSTLILEGAVRADVVAREEGFWRLKFDAGVEEVLDAHGRMPLPPYIQRAAETLDEERYQTVYARAPGAVAAPTAGLHLDAALFAALEARGVACATLTLHVGAGTFQPVRTENLDEHVMHRERYEIPPATADAVAATRAKGRRIVAIGTTTLRALEAAAAPAGVAAGQGETALFIRPGYRFKIVDMLMTNFHLPRSTLLVLVTAFAGNQTIRAAYQHAIAGRYRFFSYGDAMLLARS